MATMRGETIPWNELSKAEQVARLSPDERAAMFADMPEADWAYLEHDWTFWGRPEQLPPWERDDWDIFLMMAGRGAGKTRPGAEIVHHWAANPGWYLALVGETAAEVRDVMLDGESGLLATQKPWNPCKYEPSKRRVVWQNGSWATCFSGDTPSQLRGPNCHGAWVDEWAKFKYPDDTWNNLELILRAGEHPRAVVTTTPRPLTVLKDLIADPRTCLRRWSTYRNAANLAPTFIQRILSRYEGTRLGRQELHAEILADAPDALWQYALLDATRVPQIPAGWQIDAVAIGIDPPGGLVTECGIVASARASDEIHVAPDNGFVLADTSCAGKPEKWASAAWELAQTLAHTYDVRPWLIAERNHGGEMVRATLEVARPPGCSFRVELVNASRGKAARAEPVVMLYEQHRYHHVGTFPALEDEMTQWNPFDTSLPSPNRLDALVWSAHGLQLAGTKVLRAGAWGR